MEDNIIIQKEDIKSLIYEIRGKQVMLDSDLALLYNCKNGTKEINQAVKNNIDKFPEMFSWKLSDSEVKDLRSKFLTANLKSKSRTNPRVFTEQGIEILSTIIKSSKDISTEILNNFREKNSSLLLIGNDGNAENIRNLIYEIRGKQVMIDYDLARLYECSNGTKDVNKAVNRNVEKFPSDFYFQLTDEEYNNLKFQFGTSSLKKHGGVRKMPYVFTEQGVAMLATILRTGVATKMSVAIMRAFVAMRIYIGFNESRMSNVEIKLLEHDSKIKYLQETLNKFEEKKKINEIYFDGQIFDAYSKIYEIFNCAKKKLIIIDSYADNTILDIIKRLSVEATIVTKENNLLTKQDITKYNKQYHNLKVIYNNTFHDRYFILDEKEIYHCGASINRIGYKTFSITLINDDYVCKMLMSKINEIICS